MTDFCYFVPATIEACGMIKPLAFNYFKDLGLGHRLKIDTDEPRVREYLVQRISVAVKEGTALSWVLCRMFDL